MTTTTKTKKTNNAYIKDVMEEISFNVDDMTGEEISYAVDKIFEAGANEAYTSSVYMKKGRPGILFTVICAKKSHDKVLEAIFKHTSTVGVRCIVKDTYRLQREIIEEKTKYGKVHKKLSSVNKISKEKYEFEDIKKIADKYDLSIKEVLKELNKEG